MTHRTAVACTWRICDCPGATKFAHRRDTCRVLCTYCLSPVGHIGLPFGEWDTNLRLPPDSQWVVDVRFCLLSSPGQLVRPLDGFCDVLSQESIQLLVHHFSHDMWQRPRIVVLGNSIVTWPHLFWQPGVSPQTRWRTRVHSPATSATEDSASSSPCVRRRGLIGETPLSSVRPCPASSCPQVWPWRWLPSDFHILADVNPKSVFGGFDIRTCLG